MSGIYVNFSINNVVFIGEKFEMILWKIFCIMIYVLALHVCRCSTYRKEKNILSKYYCEGLNWGKVNYNSFLWSVKRSNSPPVYLFGTIHAPYDLVWRYIPTNAKDALMDSTHVFTEVNLKDPKVINDIYNCRNLPGNLTLKDVLPRKLHDKLLKTLHRFESRKRKWISKLTQSLFKDYLVHSPDIYRQYEKLKPVWLISTILQQWNKFAVKLMFKRRASLDSYLVTIADELGAYSGGIEDVSMHCDPMDNLGTAQVNLALNVTLHSQNYRMSGKWKFKENDIRRVANLYKCGDPLNTSKLGTLFSDFVDESLRKKLEEIDEYFARELVYKRNIHMANRVDAMMKNDKYDNAKMFFAVGAAHLLGNGSIVTLLREKGYTVTHIKPNEEIPATIEKKRLENEGQKLYMEAMNSSLWKEVDKKDIGIKPIIIIKKVEKKYVYYYNGGHRVSGNKIWNLIGLALVLFLL